jgi:uncharacterized damage-inducible protein DinB
VRKHGSVWNPPDLAVGRFKIYDSTLLRLRTQLSVLPLIVDGVSSAALQRRPAPGKWSAHEHLAHLARYHEVLIERLKTMLDAEAPKLGRYRSEEDPDWDLWASKSSPEVLDRLLALRAALVQQVELLDQDQMQRIGVHPRLGPMPIALWLEFFILHEGHHLYTIMTLLPQARVSPPRL